MTIHIPDNFLIIQNEHNLSLDDVRAKARQGVWLPDDSLWVLHRQTTALLSFKLTKAPTAEAWWNWVIGEN